MSLLEGKAIAITGAGSGIGAAYARHCAKLGARIVVNDLVADAAEAVAAEIRDKGGAASACPGNVADWSFGAELVSACRSAFGRIDGLVNNAGIGKPPFTLEDADETALDTMWEVNVKGPLLSLRQVGKAMAATGKGAIVNSSRGVMHAYASGPLKDFGEEHWKEAVEQAVKTFHAEISQLASEPAAP